MYSEIEQKLIDLAAKYSEDKIDFVWDLPDGLKNVSDETLELAYELLLRTEIKLEEKDKKVIIRNGYNSFCDYKSSTSDLLEETRNSSTKTKPLSTSYSVGIACSINRVCENCHYQKCPKHVVGYIYYLMVKGKFVEALDERKEYIKNNEVNPMYSYVWQFGDVLKYISDEMFEYCMEKVRRKKVYVSRYLIDDKSISIKDPSTCFDEKNIGLDKEKINDLNIPFEKWYSLKRSPSKPVSFCNNYSCRLGGCPTVIAGVLHYLIVSGKQDFIDKERQYYHDHKDEMDKKRQKLIDDKLNEIKEDTANALNNLNEFKEKIENYDDLITSLTNKNQSSFYCIIEGEDVKERNAIVDTIGKFLITDRSLDDKESPRKTLQSFAASRVYLTSDDSRYKKLQKNNLNKDELYILTDVGEFISDYNVFKNLNTDYLHYEIRKKQYIHSVDLLSELARSNYIIIEGTTKEIDAFLELDPRLKYIYQGSRYKISEFSLDDAFLSYTANLDNSLFYKLKENYDSHKKAFLEYITLNKNFIPFDNRELAIYLALYSNSKGDLVFPNNIYKKETVEEALKNIIGLENVKQKVKDFEKFMLFKVKAESDGIKLPSSNMHMVFTGNPGTGKTTIARIMAKMLYDMGIIKENKLVEVERKDLIGQYIGQTAPKTYEVINKAMGGVLFIDEAYSLANESKKDFGGEAIATLIKAMEDHKDNLVVIFAGYKKEMAEFIDMNSGIASRIGYTFDFEDYSNDELTEMFNKKIKNMGFEFDEKCETDLKNLFEYFSRRKGFGNGRFVDKLIQETILKHAINESPSINRIVKEDIPSIREMNNASDPEENTDDLLLNIVGLENLKTKIKEFEEYVKFIKLAEKNNITIPDQNLHMIFTGNPGTGKTTIARIMAKILYNAGVIHENKLIEVERKDLIGQYIGQTAPKTYEVIARAIGGILFIDEAYSLSSDSKNDYGSEAIATLIKAMEDHKGEFVVIFAGYKKEMKEFIDMNSGIASRIGYTFEFEDYNKEELTEIFLKKVSKSNLTITDEAKEKVKSLMSYFVGVENIGNGRFADKVYMNTLVKHAKNNSKNISVITEDDIPSVKEMTDTIFNGNNMINPDEIDEKAYRKTAIHEIGHALVRYVLYNEPGILKITINPEGRGTLGYVMYKDSKVSYVNSKSELLNKIKVSLAGMAAEELFIGEFANGNTSDLEKATTIAKNMVTKFGMSRFGIGQIDNISGELATRVTEEINYILDDCYTDTKKILADNKNKVLALVDYVLDKKEISEEEFINVIKQKEV